MDLEPGLVIYLGGKHLWELWEEELWFWEEELWLRPRDVDVVFLEDHLDLEPRRKGSTVQFRHDVRGDEVSDLGPRPVVPPKPLPWSTRFRQHGQF